MDVALVKPVQIIKNVANTVRKTSHILYLNKFFLNKL